METGPTTSTALSSQRGVEHLKRRSLSETPSHGTTVGQRKRTATLSFLDPESNPSDRSTRVWNASFLCRFTQRYAAIIARPARTRNQFCVECLCTTEAVSSNIKDPKLITWRCPLCTHCRNLEADQFVLNSVQKADILCRKMA